MDFLLNRYRNLSVLVIVLLGQLFLLAYQVKTGQDVRLIRVWASYAVTPPARLLDTLRSKVVGTVEQYTDLLDVREENERLRESIGELKLENQFLKNELSTAERAQVLAIFQQRTPSRTVAARVIGNSTSTGSMVVFLDRGADSGLAGGMAVITPEGIVGRVIAAYPASAQVLLVTDPNFAAGVISQVGRVHGTLRGLNRRTCVIDYVQNDSMVAVGEWFYTSGDDRLFPRGLPVGQVSVSSEGNSAFREIRLVPSGLQQSLEEVLVVLEGVHQPVPAVSEQAPVLKLLPPPPADNAPAADAPAVTGSLSTDADLLAERYRRLGQRQGHVFGSGPAPKELNPAPDSGPGP